MKRIVPCPAAGHVTKTEEPTVTTHISRRNTSVGDAALEAILGEIAVPVDVLEEAKRRRGVVLQAAMEHEAARAAYVSGSVAHGTENKPLEDADCGVKINRRFEAFRAFGPDAEGIGKGPEEFVQMFADFVLPRVRKRGYPEATVDLSGNRAIKVEFNTPVEFDEWGEVDPYVDLIIGLTRAAGGLWIPNRESNWWDPADPELHTELMTERDEKALRVFRARLLRLTKRAVKRDGKVPGHVKVMCSWNISALGLELIEETATLAIGLATFLDRAADSIEIALTEDPSPVIEDAIPLPDGVTNARAATRLREMAAIVWEAVGATSKQGAMAHLTAMFGAEIDAIRAREDRLLRSGSPAAVAEVLGVAQPLKRTRSDGA
jgi:hypothetical protein